MEILKDFLAPGGFVFMGFPAWQMPFGGHQQIAAGKFVSHMPFLHLLPAKFYRCILNVSGERADTVKELLEIKETRCPIELFERVVRDSGFSVAESEFWFVKPHYETKFGLKPRRLSRAVAAIPWLRNFFCSGCLYVLHKNEEQI